MKLAIIVDVYVSAVLEGMAITKINIENFKCYNGKFSLQLNKGINILVDNPQPLNCTPESRPKMV